MMHILLPVLALSVPTWPDQATWKGEFRLPALNWTSPISTFYDVTGAQPMWAQKIVNYDVNYVYMGTTKYEFKTQGANPTCSKSVIDEFPYPKNQFENFTLVSTDDRITERGTPVHSWVGTGKLGYALSMDTVDDEHHTLRRIVYIDEPGWHTEIRVYDEVRPEVPADAFTLPSYCN